MIKQKKLTLTLRNNSDQEVPVALFVKNLATNANAQTRYRYDLTGYGFDDNEITLQARTVGSPEFTTYNLGVLSSVADLLSALQALGFGAWVFDAATNGLSIDNDQMVFGELAIGALDTFHYTMEGTRTGFILNFQEPSLVTVDWGDGTVEENVDTGWFIEHTYATPGRRTVRITLEEGTEDKLEDLSMAMYGEMLSLSSLTKLTGCVSLGTSAFGEPSNFSSFVDLPPNLTLLVSDQGKLTRLPELPASLKTLIVHDNLLTSLPALPPGLEQLDCHSNPSLTSLPALPATITSIDAWSCALTQLPALPPVLESLLVDYNNLMGLPPLPASLTFLSASENNMASLPPLPPGLTYLSVDLNKLSALPALPNTLKELRASGNKLTDLINALPASLETCQLNSNLIESFSSFTMPVGVLDFQMRENRLTVASVSLFLMNLDSNGKNNGRVLLDRQTPPAPPAGAGITAMNALIVKNWEVLTD